ncbi:maestro heat-like repeat family member 5 isoform X9 [Prionailurus iriomotensis]
MEGVRSLWPRKGWPQPPEGVAGGEGAPAAQKAGLCVPVGGPGSKEQADVRGGAILLYGDVLYSGGKKYQQALKNHAFQALVPLFFHLADSCPKVVMKTKLTFLRCAVLLKWEFRKELFGKLAWGRGLSAENDVFIYTVVESNLGNYHRFLMQALTYLSSPDRNLKQAAMKFINLEILKQDPDSMSRRFYSSFLEDIWELSQYVTH